MTPEQKAAERYALDKVPANTFPAHIAGNSRRSYKQAVLFGAQWQRENGWIEITSEDSLPIEDNTEVLVRLKWGRYSVATYMANNFWGIANYYKGAATHYMIITPPKTQEDGK